MIGLEKKNISEICRWFVFKNEKGTIKSGHQNGKKLWKNLCNWNSADVGHSYSKIKDYL